MKKVVVHNHVPLRRARDAAGENHDLKSGQFSSYGVKHGLGEEEKAKYDVNSEHINNGHAGAPKLRAAAAAMLKGRTNLASSYATHAAAMGHPAAQGFLKHHGLLGKSGFDAAPAPRSQSEASQHRYESGREQAGYKKNDPEHNAKVENEHVPLGNGKTAARKNVNPVTRRLLGWDAATYPCTAKMMKDAETAHDPSSGQFSGEADTHKKAAAYHARRSEEFKQRQIGARGGQVKMNLKSAETHHNQASQHHELAASHYQKGDPHSARYNAGRADEHARNASRHFA